MTKESYERISAPFRAHPAALHGLLATNKALTCAGYILYPALLIALGISGETELLARCVAVPAIAFALVTLARRALNAPRPYEALDIEPLIDKDTRGRSFPSRHVFSMFMIAASWAAWCVPLGVALAAAGAAMAAVRVIGGVHYPRDVIAGALCALVAGAIGYAGVI